MNERDIDLEIQKHVNKNGKIMIPDIVKDRINQTLSDLPNPAIKNNYKFIHHSSRKRKGPLAAMIATVMISGVIVSGFVSPTFAKTLSQIPLIGNIFDFVGDTGLKEANKKGLSVAVNQSATDQGITLNIKEIIYDGLRLSVGYVEESETGLPTIERSRPRYHYKSTDEFTGWVLNESGYTPIDINHNVGVFNFEYLKEKETPPDQFNLQFELNQIGDKKGSWKFNIPITQNYSHTKKYIPMITKEAGDSSLTLKSITISPSGTEIKLQSVFNQSKELNPILGINTYYQLIDDQGESIALLSGGGNNSSSNLNDEIQSFEHTYLFEPLRSNAKHLTLKPYTGGYHTGDIKVKLSKQLPMTIKQGEIGSITITKVDFLEDKTVMYYDVIGDDPWSQSGPVWFLDENGKEIKDETKSQYLINYENGRYSFKREYPVINKDEKLFIYTKEMGKVKFYNEFEIKVSLE